MITLKNVCKIYHKGTDSQVDALKGISLQIKKGEFAAIMGPSGSGKSTLLNLIGCMDKATSGEIWIDGHAVHNDSEIKLHQTRRKYISFVFQNFALMEHYSIWENIELPLLARNVSGKQRKRLVSEQMELLGISEIAQKRPSQCSGGQQQRAAVARAVVSGCPILLADEPTGALDQATGMEMMKLLKGLNRSGKTVILITHDDKVASFADRIIRIVDGRLEEEKENEAMD